MAVFEGKNGRWITTKTGKHVFIEDGKTVEEALGEAFEEYTYDVDIDEEPDEETEEFDPDLDFDLEPMSDQMIVEATANDYRKLFNDTYCKWHYADKETGKRIPAAQVVKNRFENAMLFRDIYDEELEKSIILKGKDCLWVIKDYGGSVFNHGLQFLNSKLFTNGKMQISVEIRNKNRIRETFFHEAGHMLDYDKDSKKCYSHTYKSKKYDKTLHDMIYDELINVPITAFQEAENAYKSELDKYKEEYGTGNVNYENEYYRLWQNCSSIADMCQAVKGEELCKKVFDGYLGHKSGYYTENSWARNTQRGSEFFAEMTASILMDKEHLFYKFMRKHAPKSVEIYHEILKEKIYGK